MKTKKIKDRIQDPEYGLDSRFKSSKELSEGRYKNMREDIRSGQGLLENEENKAINLKNAVSKGLESPRVENFNFDENLKHLKTKKSRQ